MTEDEARAGLERLAQEWETEVMGGLQGMFTMSSNEVYDGPAILWCRTHDECYLAAEGHEPEHNVERCGELSQYFPSARED